MGKFSKNYRTFYPQTFVTKLSKIWDWDPGSKILDPRSGKTLFRVPDPGPVVKKAPDPGSATLIFRDIPGWKKFGSGINIRGLQCLKLNGNHTENDRYCQKNNFLLFAKCLKMYIFFSHLHFKIAKSAIMTQKFFLLKNINMGIKKTQNFMLISNSLVPIYTNAPKKS